MHMVPSLPEDIILTEILPLLPVQTLLRSRCVCKSWNSLISDPGFVNSHLRCTTQDLIVRTGKFRLFNDVFIYCYATSILSLTNLSETNLLCDVPYRKGPRIDLLGSINGLLCLFYYEKDEILIWNPAIRQAKKIRAPDRMNEYRSIPFLTGFCWDALKNDYKVVFCYKDDKELYPYYVYSSNSDSWTWNLLSCFSFVDNAFRPQYTLVSGESYWTFSSMSCKEKLFLVKFEVGSNEFRVLPEFDYAQYGEKGFVIVNLKGCISLLVYKPRSLGCLVKVYCLDERCGVWSNMYNIGPITGYVDKLILCFNYDGKIVFFDNEKLMCYDPKTNKIIHLADMKGYPTSCFSYNASLVFLQGMKRLHQDMY